MSDRHLAQFLETLTANLQNSTPNHSIRCSAEPLRVSADRVIPMGLMVNELVTNAIKYAYPDRNEEVRIFVINADGTGYESERRVSVR